VGGFQNALLFNKMPDWFALGSAALLALVLMAISLLLFRKAGPEMVDQL
jgi:lipopolysaccharide transport system permease protein